MLPFLLPILTSVAPECITWLFGAKADKATTAMVAAVKAVTGADPSTQAGADAAHQAIAADPDKAIALQVQLATLNAQMQAEANREQDVQRQSDIDALRATLADVASARAQTVALAQTGSGMAYSAAILSAIILLAFGVMLYVVLTRSVPASTESEAGILLGTLAAMASQVANYWLGSSSGSAAKTALLSARKAG